MRLTLRLELKKRSSVLNLNEHCRYVVIKVERRVFGAFTGHDFFRLRIIARAPSYINVYSKIIRNNVATFLLHSGIHKRASHCNLYLPPMERQVKIQLSKRRFYNVREIVNIH